jgi:hypothetical protein
LGLHYFLTLGQEHLVSPDSSRAKAQLEAGENAVWKPDFNRGQLRSTTMKVTMQDTEIIDNIEPHQLREYLQSHGWHEDRAFLDNTTIWHKQVERG